MAGTDPFGFGKFVPGFDFLQGLSKQAATNIPQLPNMANWIAPTLNVDELDKRLDELKQVQFWLDQNAKALAAVIQALEVQKMTLSTLKDMNFNLGDVANAFKLKAADTVMSGVGRAAAAATGAASEAVKAASSGDNPIKAAAKVAKAAKAGLTDAATPGAAEAMQWWGSLTKQFADIAGQAMQQAGQRSALDAAKNMASEIAKGGMKATEAMAKAAMAGTAVAPKKGAAKPMDTMTSGQKSMKMASNPARTTSAPAKSKARSASAKTSSKSAGPAPKKSAFAKARARTSG